MKGICFTRNFYSSFISRILSMCSVKGLITLVVFFQVTILPHFVIAQQGLVAEYFNDIKLENKVLTRVESKPHLYFIQEHPAPGVNDEYFSTRWTAIITAPSSGEYTFSLQADDGVRLWIDGQLLIDAWRDQEVTSYEESILLEKGRQYKLKIEYYNTIIHAILQFLWRIPEDGFSIFGYSFFRTLRQIPATVFSVDSTVLSKTVITPPAPKVIAKPAIENKKIASRIPVADKKPKKPDEQSINAPPVIAVNRLIEFKSVRFVLATCELLDSSYTELDAIVAYMKNHPNLKIRIVGHTDYQGERSANYTLSKQRADAVSNYLKANGIISDRLFTEGMGPSKPIVFDDKPQNRTENRRVEFMLVY